MTKIRSLYLALFVASALTMSACSGGEQSYSDEGPDTLVNDAATDSGNTGDSTQDVNSPDEITTSDVAVDLAIDSGTDATPDVPEIKPITTVGQFLYDFVQAAPSKKVDFLTVQAGRRHQTAVNECGLMGFVFTDRSLDGVGNYNNSLIFSEINLDNPPEMGAPVSRATLQSLTGTDYPVHWSASLAYDDCVPMVFAANETGFVYTRVGGGMIEWLPVDTTGTYSEITSYGAQLGRDDKIHLIFQGRPAGKTMQWIDSAWNGTSFTVTIMPAPDLALTSVIDVAISDDGRLVIGYIRNETTAPEAWVARYNGTTWDREQIAGVTPSTEFGLSFALGSYNRESLAWAQATKTDEGLVLSVALKYTYRDIDGTFKTETVMLDTDGYNGGGGSRFTGASPILVIDPSGRPHIVFSDIAMFTSGETQTWHFGQVRYAWRKGGKWTDSTLLAQEPPGQTIESTGWRGLCTSRDGTRAGIAAVTISDSNGLDSAINTVGISVESIK